MALNTAAARAARWRQAVALHAELVRLEAMRETAKPSHYAALVTKALRSGHDGVAATALIVLGARSQGARADEESKGVTERNRALITVTRPASIALLELELRLGVENEVAPDKQREQVRGTLAHSILLAIYARLAKTRIRELQGLHDRAVGEEKFLEAALCDLFLISEFRKAADRKGEKAVLADLKKLERDFGVRDDEGEPYSESVAPRPRTKGAKHK